MKCASLLLCRFFYRIRVNVIVTGRNDLALGMIEMLRRVLNPQRLRVRVVEWVPNHIEPITVCQLRCLVPLIRREADGLPSTAALHLDSADTSNRITIASLWIGRADTAHIESNFQVPYALTLEPTGSLEGDDHILSGHFAFAPHFRVEIVEGDTDLLFDGACRREYQRSGDVADGRAWPTSVSASPQGVPCASVLGKL